MSPLVYELNARCWLRGLSERAGRRVDLANIPESEFLRWRHLGFTHIWLMGVWTTGPRSRAVAAAIRDLQRTFGESLKRIRKIDIGGSPYAIAAYRVPRALGGETALQRFRERLHARGMKLLLDFVPNHVGLDHPWLRQRPELFVQTAQDEPGAFEQETNSGLRRIAHGRDPNFAPWKDTAQLDYRRPATHAAMRNELLDVAKRCDGVRCDMAMLVLNDVFAGTWARCPGPGSDANASMIGADTKHVDANGDSNRAPEIGMVETRKPMPEFWREAIAATKRAHPDFLFLAEVYWGLEERLQSIGFDYTYDKVLYDLLIQRAPAAVQKHLLDAAPRFIQAGAHFIENHDEPRAAALFSPPEHRAAALLILGLPGLRLLHDGQLSGTRIQVPVQLSCRPAEPPQAEIEEMYDRLLTTLSRTAVGKGSATLLTPREAWPGNPGAQDFILIQWQSASTEFDLVAINLAPHSSQCFAPLDVAQLAAHDWQMNDLLGPEQYTRSGPDLKANGLFLDLHAHAAQLFHFQKLGS